MTLLLCSAATAHASGVLVPPGTTGPTTFDAEIAIAVTPYGTTRWTRLTVGGSQNVMWLVPARPGAALDWATDAWLTALEAATSPHVAPPSASAPCQMPSDTERVAPWSTTGVKRFPKAVLVHTSEAEALAHVAARGFAVPASVATKIATIYARGYALVSLELDVSASSISSSPTLRISDDGGAVVPLALTGSTQTAVRVTAIVIGDGPSTLAGARELEPGALTWGPAHSTYAGSRARTLVAGGGAIWLREAASHELMFAGLAVPRDTPIEPLVTGYFHSANGQAQPVCDAAALAAASGAGTVGRLCASGSLALVPGGAACVPASGTIDPTTFTCGSGVDDLALALSGGAPSRSFVTRFTGLVPQSGFGIDTTIATSTTSLSPVVFAGKYEPCPVVVTPPSGGSGSPSPTPGAASGDPRPYHFDQDNSGCNGSATTVVYEDTGEEAVVADEGCGSTSTGTGTSTGDDGDNCGGDTSSSSSSSTSSSSSSSGSSDSSGWDDDDDDDDDSDSSSSKSDSCDCGKSSTGSSTSSSGWDDDSSEAAPQSLRLGGEPSASTPRAGKAKRHHKKRSSNKARGRSPVSRYALLFVALLLPLRRRLRLKRL